MLDVTFLASNWRCIFGQGCQGVLTGPAPEMVQGCCFYGAHLADDDEVARVEAAAATLSDEHWQFRRQGQKKGVVKRGRDDEIVTRLVDDACIFLNRPDFAGGPGCAFHQAAEAAGRPHYELKPDVCWQLPLRREDSSSEDGHVVSRISEWDRRHWGAGGQEFHWWCTEAPEAFTGHEPVYVSMRLELIAMVGEDVYDRLVAYVEAGRSRPVDPREAARRSSFPIRPSGAGNEDPQSGSGSSPSPAPGCPTSPRSALNSSSGTRHHEAWPSSGSAPHSAHRRPAVTTDRFRLRASSNRR